MSQNPFSKLASEASKGDGRLRQENISWENDRLCHMLTKLGFNKDTQRELTRLGREKHNDFMMRFEDFYANHADFPITFGIHKLKSLSLPYGKRQTPIGYQIHTDPYSTEPSRFRKFDWVPFVIAYREFVEELGEEADLRPTGLIFPRKGIPQGMVIHNDSSEKFWDAGLCWVYKDVDTGEQLYVQPFASLLEGIKKVWRPG